MEVIDLQEIQKSLEEERKMLLETIQQSELDSTSNDSINPGRSDLAWRYERRQRKVLLLTRAKEHLSEVEAAIQRLDNGIYGICQKCGQTINPERLRVLPTAVLCICCQKQEQVLY